MSNTPTFKDAPFAFNQAIAEGRLSSDQHSHIYAGKFMYMGTVDGVDQFKNIITRQYLEEFVADPVFEYCRTRKVDARGYRTLADA